MVTRFGLEGRMVPAGDISLWVHDQGTGPLVLLMAGADHPGLRWTPAFIDPLIEAGFRVVRFDNRDAGRSSRFAADSGYGLRDMAHDAVQLLDALEIDQGHVIGHSMGGMIAQVMALEHPERVSSLVLMATTPGAGDERLPQAEDAFVRAVSARLLGGAPVGSEARVNWIVELQQLMAGPRYSFDVEAERMVAQSEVLHGWYPESGHGVAVFDSPSRYHEVGAITAPTLVVHGTSDPVFPIEHGRWLAARVDGAVGVEIEGWGHDLPDGLAADIMATIVSHLIRVQPG